MQKIIFIAFAMVILLAVMLFNDTTDSSLAKTVSYPEKKEIICIRKEPMKRADKKISIDKESHIQEPEVSYQELTLYEMLSIDEATLTTRPRKNIKPIEAISLKSLSDTKINDTLTLPNIEGIDYTIIISSISTNSDGSISTTGQFEDEGISYTTTITEAKESSYITLSTPQGIYEIETQNGVGYIYKTSDIRRHLHTNHKDDMIPYTPKTEKKAY